MKFYVAGPMRGYDQFNFPMFDKCVAFLEAGGHEAISPADMDRALGFDETVAEEFALEGFDMEDAVRRDVNAVIESDGICLLPGWEKSSGVQFEVAAAKFLGRKIVWFATLADGAWALWHEDPVEYYARTSASSEIRIIDPDTGGAKGQKLARMDLIPWDAITTLAEHFGKGAEKYEPRNWERGYAWGLSAAAAQRHFAAWWQGEDVDEDGFSHLTAWAWHAIALLAQSQRGIGTDDRPSTGLPQRKAVQVA